MNIGLHFDISERAYHADLVSDVPSLSCSIAKTLIDWSPAHAWSEHPKLGHRKVSEPTSEQEYGSAVHKLCLGRGAEIVVCEEDTWQKKDARLFRDAAREAGKIPILRHKLEQAEEAKAVFLASLSDFGLREEFDAAQSEVVMIYQDGQVRCRGMIDKLLIDETSQRARIFDIKTTGCVKPSKLERVIDDQHYDMQNVSYKNGLALLRPDLSGRISFLFLFQETDYPYTVQPVELDGEFCAIGQSKWTRAHQTWEACMRANKWPTYSKQIERLSPPAYALNREMGAKAILP